MSDDHETAADRKIPGGMIPVVTIVAVGTLGGLMLYLSATGAPAAEIEATRALANTVGKAGFALFASVAIVSGVLRA